MRMTEDTVMAELDIKKAEELEEKYDSGLQTRVIGPYLVKFTFYFSKYEDAYFLKVLRIKGFSLLLVIKF